ncbi:ferritin-like domain-containing protein [Streptomyces sp. XD-27]|uniref:ferritin-like domain-containing protein n=1 Tax=Streptomyces sp. XD-27 TaxID=3062779 RepID=UPI0026F4705C|nr:ferritin-like domain-containing protein [Streptomyces sp. XD-27]WKX73916.1 ferritin-like domain-containing protein [Streptomyces sp. XD-27]
MAPYTGNGVWAAGSCFIEDARAHDWQPREAVRSALRDRPGRERPSELSWRLACGSTYAEQVGLDVAASLLHTCPEADMKWVLATAVADEAKHSAAFHEYARSVADSVLEPSDAVDELSRDLMGMDDYTARFIAHTLAEGFAADEFHWFVQGLRRDGLGAVYRLVRRDENRHVALGMAYLTRGPGVARLRAMPADLFLESERTVLRHNDTESIGSLVHRLLPDVVGEDVAVWLRARHETRMRVLMNVRRDGEELSRRRQYEMHPTTQ